MKEKEVDDTLQAAKGDSTNLNARIHDVMRSLKIQNSRKLVWLVCISHTNELPLQQFINELDGPPCQIICSVVPSEKNKQRIHTDYNE